MAVAVVHEWSTGGHDTTNYDAINERLNEHEAPPPGMIVHTAGATEGGGFRVFDVWESKADYELFERERLMPAVQAVMAGHEGPPPPPPTVSVYELHALIHP
jgi:hypothetical protein